MNSKEKEKEKEDEEIDSMYIGIEEHTQRLLLFQTQADVEEILKIKKKLLRRLGGNRKYLLDID